jgi:hypothetical protein
LTTHALSGSDAMPAIWTPRRELDDEQHGVPFQARCGPDLQREEIRRGEDVPVGFHELLPRRPLLPLGSGLNPVLPEDGGEGPAPDVVAHVGERSLNPRVAPVAILGCHADDPLPNLGRHRRPSRPALVMAVVFPGRFRCHASRVSGLTMVPISWSTLRRRSFALAAKRMR